MSERLLNCIMWSFAVLAAAGALALLLLVLATTVWLLS